ncbi:interleukin-21 [Acanthopagrus latus]|uniref:interleukin-21 n=1 Tax=Acanthopagrus latus TaxID=8177 RepID=UPI00187BDEB1|nr:interleukin-21 [Acanthopagrus latus]XP_036933566.1 interleukin-21 [Acanthopagrus latus]
MKLVVFCLFAVYCCSLASTATRETDRTLQRKKLQEVLKQLNAVKVSLQQSEKLLYTPPRNIEDCCCLSALKCFQANLEVSFNVKEGRQRQLFRSLKHPLTERGLNFCSSPNVNSTCQECVSHPRQNATEFYNRLESLIQMAISRLTMI